MSKIEPSVEKMIMPILLELKSEFDVYLKKYQTIEGVLPGGWENNRRIGCLYLSVYKKSFEQTNSLDFTFSYAIQNTIINYSFDVMHSDGNLVLEIQEGHIFLNEIESLKFIIRERLINLKSILYKEIDNFMLKEL